MRWWFSRSKVTEPEAEIDESSASKTDSSPPASAHLLDLQQTVGNQAVQRMIADSPAGEAGLSVTHTSHAGGEALPQDIRELMEARFGADFNEVRIHADEEAARSTVEHDAQAYTTNRDIYFAPGKYAPQTTEGAHLLAHELAHVVQQTKGAEGRNERDFASDPEAEAGRAADRVTTGAPMDFALSAAQAGAPARAPADWGKDVTDAKAAKDAAKMAALVETAIASMKKKVVVAKTSPGGNIDPKDYQPLADLNFDINLNSKKSKPLSSGAAAAAATRSLATNYGYFFTDGGKTYVILGPNTLNEDSPIFTRMHVEHELYHTTHHTAAASKSSAPAQTTQPATTPAPGPVSSAFDDQELETYTQDFITYFHQLYSFRPAWSPLITFYETASAPAQKSGLALLQGYYKSPPSPPIAATDVPKIKKAFENWVRRRLKDSATASKKLIQDLSSSLGISLSAASPGGTPSPAPSGSSTPPPGEP